MSDTKKRSRLSRESEPFDALPDDLLIFILSKLCSSSSSPSDFINALLVCRRFNRLGLNPSVLSSASSNVFSIRPKNWSDSADQFIKRCIYSGSVEAFYFLGMVRFYCLGQGRSGASLMTKAAVKSHAPSLYSLALIHFNGSGGTKTNKNLRAGAALCARAASLGHVDALRELGHCLQDGYGVNHSVVNGSRLLIQANARELAMSSRLKLTFPRFGCVVRDLDRQPVNRFLREWFELKGGLSGQGVGLCSYLGCGRPETRPYEFRKCSACAVAKYCSRGCQANDWKVRHKVECGLVAVMGVQPEFMGVQIG